MHRRVSSKLLALFVVTSFLRGVLAAPGDPTLVAVPTLGGEPPRPIAIADGDATVATQTGALEYAFPIDVPPSDRGPQASLALQYSSHGSTYGTVAAQWSLAVPEIRQDTTERLLTDYPANPDRPRHFISTLAGGHRLVPVLEPREADVEQTYRAQYDDSFARYEKLHTNPAWRVRAPDGTTYIFGDRNHQGGIDDPERALLSAEIDKFGNRVNYFWQPVYVPEYAHPVDFALASVEYAANPTASPAIEAHVRITLEYAPLSACPGESLPIGAQRENALGKPRYLGARKLTAIQTNVRVTGTTPTNTCGIAAPSGFRPVRRIELTYDDASTGSAEHTESCTGYSAPFRQIRAISETGVSPSGVCAYEPEVSFEYGAPTRELNRATEFKIPATGPSNNALVWGYQHLGSWPTLESNLVDMDNDGRLDRVFMLDSASCTYAWERNNGSGFDPYAGSFQLPKAAWVNGTRGSSTYSREWCALNAQHTMRGNRSPTHCSSSPGNYLAYRLLNIDGDGLPDLVAAFHYSPEFYDPHTDSYFGLPIPSCTGGPVCPDAPDTCRSPNLSGDPNALISCIETSTAIPCGDLMKPEPSGDPEAPPYPGSPPSESGICEAPSDSCLETGPVLPPGSPTPSPCEQHEPLMACGNYVWYVYRNLGNGTFAATPQTVLAPAPLESDNGDSSMGSSRWGFASETHAVMDFTGDGIVDVAVVSDTRMDDPLPLEPDWWYVFPGDGEGNFTVADNGWPYVWLVPRHARPGWSATASSAFQRKVWSGEMLLDINGDGLVDLVRMDWTDSKLYVHFNDGLSFRPYWNPSERTLFTDVTNSTSFNLIDIVTMAGKLVVDGVSEAYRRPLDFDGDGRPDYYIRRGSRKEIALNGGQVLLAPIPVTGVDASGLVKKAVQGTPETPGSTC